MIPLSSIKPEEILNTHIALCDETYKTLQDENAHLKREKSAPTQEILQRKKELLAKLDDSNQSLKALNASKVIAPPNIKKLIDAAQNKIMKIFLLDRENEQLLLKYAITTTRPEIPQTPPSKRQIKDTYGA